MSSCLELLEDQGFKAEHQLFVRMISCMNAYWSTDTFGPDQNTFDPSGIVGTAIEEGELESESESFIGAVFVENFQKARKERKWGNGIKMEHIAAQSETISSQQELATDSEETKAKEFSHVLKPHIYTFSCKYCPFTLKAREKGRKFRFKLRKHNKAEHHVCEVCRKKNSDKEELERHMATEHKDSNRRLVCGIKGCTASPKDMLTCPRYDPLDLQAV